jgi:hypothetical protein
MNGAVAAKDQGGVEMVICSSLFVYLWIGGNAVEGLKCFA